MARREAHPPAEQEVRLPPRLIHCISGGQQLWVAYQAQRTVMTFRGLVRLRVVVQRCRNPACEVYQWQQLSRKRS